MSEEVTNAITQLKELLNKYPDKKLEILQYVFGKDTIMKIINRPTYDELEQENQQLKENNMSMQEEMVRTWKKADKYKEVIEEVKEYINHEWFKRGQLGIIDKSFQEWQLKDILQILDKVDKNHVY